MIRTFVVSVTSFVTDAVHPSEGHYATRWQVRLVGDPWWPSLFDSDWDTVNKLVYTFNFLPGTYEVRVAFMDEFFIASPWSEPIEVEFDDVPAFELPIGALLDLFIGSDANDLLLYGAGIRDGALNYAARAETVELAPAGSASEYLFTRLYVVVKNKGASSVRVTPFVNGVALAAATIDCPAHAEPESNLYVVDLRPAGAVADMANVLGVRGTWITVKSEVLTFLDSFTAIEHVGVEGEEVTELLQAFAAERMVSSDREELASVYLGSEGDDLLKFGYGTDDGGAPAIVLAQTADFAPNGVAEESAFFQLHTVIERNNPDDFTIRFTPVLDGVLMDPISVLLPGVLGAITEVHALDLIQDMGDFTQGMRGVWFATKIDTTELPSGDVILHDLSLESEGTGVPPSVENVVLAGE